MGKRLKIAMVIDTYFPMIDGVVMVVDNYAKRLQEYADVTVFCPTVDKSFEDNYNYKVVRCRSFKPFFLDYVAPIPMLDNKFKKIFKGRTIRHCSYSFSLYNWVDGSQFCQA